MTNSDLISDAEDVVHGIGLELSEGVKQLREVGNDAPELWIELNDLCVVLEKAHCLAFFTKSKLKKLFLEEQSDLFFPSYQKTFTEDRVVAS